MTGISALTTTPGRRPSPTQSHMRNACGHSIVLETSWAAAAPLLRGNARNVMPNALTKHAAASAPVSASRTPATGKRKWTSGSDEERKP